MTSHHVGTTSLRQLVRLAQRPRARSQAFHVPSAASAAARAIHIPAFTSHAPISPISPAGPSRRRSILSPILSRRSATTLASPTPDSRPPLLPARPKIAVTPPSIEAIRADEFMEDMELLPREEATIVITPEAVSQLALITSREPPDVLQQGKLALRLAVDNGGCHGYQDTMSLTEDRNVDDYVFQPEGVNCIPVVIDAVSLKLLKGSTLHYATELIGSSFRIQDNPQAKAGGACGCGVSWEAA